MTDAQKQMTFNAILAFKEAWQFEQAAHLLTRKRSRLSAAPVPIVINLAFALEVYFKCLYMVEREKLLKGHKLQDLYNRQKPESKKVIEELYAQSITKEPESARLPFTTVLEWANNAFVDWRYRFENNTSSCFGNVEFVCEAVRARIIQLLNFQKLMSVSPSVPRVDRRQRCMTTVAWMNAGYAPHQP